MGILDAGSRAQHKGGFQKSWIAGFLSFCGLCAACLRRQIHVSVARMKCFCYLGRLPTCASPQNFDQSCHSNLSGLHSLFIVQYLASSVVPRTSWQSATPPQGIPWTFWGASRVNFPGAASVLSDVICKEATMQDYRNDHHHFDACLTGPAVLGCFKGRFKVISGTV